MDEVLISPVELARQRILAWLIDLMILLGLSILLGGVGWIIVAGYLLLRDGLFAGQSLGKRIIGLKVVVPGEARPCTFKDSTVRNLLWLVPIVNVVMGLTGLHALMHDRRGRHWGDRMGQTQVVAAR